MQDLARLEERDIRTSTLTGHLFWVGWARRRGVVLPGMAASIAPIPNGPAAPIAQLRLQCAYPGVTGRTPQF